MDKISHDRLMLLHPKLRDEALLIFAACEATLTGRATIRITQSLRTVAEQNELYAQGRTKPGPIVTNARGLYSNHNFGCALDFTLIIDNKIVSWDIARDWDNDRKADWMEVVAIFQKHGWSWGGSWSTFKDYPHFEKLLGYKTSDLRIKYRKGDTFIDNGHIYVNL